MRSNMAASKQALFAFAGRVKTRASTAMQKFREVMNEPRGKPYSKMTPQERMEFDLDFLDDMDDIPRSWLKMNKRK